jgi:hypothetical protein
VSVIVALGYYEPEAWADEKCGLIWRRPFWTEGVIFSALRNFPRLLPVADVEVRNPCGALCGSQTGLREASVSDDLHLPRIMEKNA